MRHRLCTKPKLLKQLLHLRLIEAFCTVLYARLLQLLYAKLHVMEVLYRLAKLIGNVRKHCLKMPECLAGSTRTVDIHLCLSTGMVDENHQAPEAAVLLNIKFLPVLNRGNELQDMMT